ncbi:hypothetical protein MN608_01938 [Microdochium nivale]|nr:hypothetical protein MN608_01938 [Microdochium nivale]
MREAIHRMSAQQAQARLEAEDAAERPRPPTLPLHRPGQNDPSTRKRRRIAGQTSPTVHPPVSLLVVVVISILACSRLCNSRRSLGSLMPRKQVHSTDINLMPDPDVLWGCDLIRRRSWPGTTAHTYVHLHAPLTRARRRQMFPMLGMKWLLQFTMTK